MPRGISWAFPNENVDPGSKHKALAQLTARIAQILPDLSGGEHLHPLDLNRILEPKLEQEIGTISDEIGLEDPIPLLAALVAASPFDAALHDGFGKANGIDCYNGLGRDYIPHDLSYYLDESFAGEYPDTYTSSVPKKSMPLYHLVGALDPLTGSDVQEPINDGVPETLHEWIMADGLTHLKIKLNGDDLEWDINRVADVNRIAEQAEAEAGKREWKFSLDFNEQCRNVDYLLDFLARLEETSPRAIARIQYIEQPSGRDLKAHPENKMHAANTIKPVVIDESLVGYESLVLSEEMGYSGVALKACKGQSQSLLLCAAAQKRGMFLCVQDLTCVSTNFMHSASLAAHMPYTAAIEGNGRQYCPGANEDMMDLYPEVFTVTNGRIRTENLKGKGLCGVPAEFGEKRFEEMG
jgi:L-alanine-DL-glutamate epimerase-like enolase superfamily enzyme